MRFVKKIFIFLILSVCFFQFPLCSSGKASSLAAENEKTQTTNFSEFFVNLFGESYVLKSAKKSEVFIGGIPLGFTLYGDGVIVVGHGEVETKNGKVSPCENVDIKAGDILLYLNDVRIDSADKIGEVINDSDLKKDAEIDAVLMRNKKRISVKITPAKDITTGKNRLGLWVRDNAAGVGTLTYVCPETGRFGALGHPVCDIDTGTHMPVKSGEIFKCHIIGIQRATKGKAGELRGLFLKSSKSVGAITKNNEFGVFGAVSEDFLKTFSNPVPVVSRKDVKPGKASILCSIDGDTPREYGIDIVKTNYQTSSKSKSMVIRITDAELIEKAGGIVQGMSGSPILQNGKLVGAVTHVFISDPTKGFGVYADWMLEQ